MIQTGLRALALAAGLAPPVQGDTLAVAAPELRVHGLDGLSICDAPIMPTIFSGSTNAPTIMIDERVPT
jgi:choline dehydrogenase-like flavoprotein